jgi:signal transduction histidine kinase
MRQSLATLLQSRRAVVLQRWAEVVAPEYAAPNGSSATDHSSGDEQRRLDTLFAALLAGCEGDSATLDRQLFALAGLDERDWPLPDLLSCCFALRRVVREALVEEALTAARMLAVLDELDALIEHATTTISRERMSQADFLAERLAQATEESDQAALQLSALNEVAQQISSSLEHAQLVQLVAEKLHEVLGVGHISIWAAEEPGLRCIYSLGDDDALAGVRLPTGADNVLLQAMRSARTAASPTLGGAEAELWRRPGCGVVALPLLVNEAVTGLVVLQDPDPDQLSRRQQTLARAVANQAAIALENARLYEQIRSFNSHLEEEVAARTIDLKAEKERLSTVHEISQEVNSTLDIDVLLRNSLDALARITNAEHGSVMLLETDTGHLVTRAVLGPQVDVGYTRFLLGAGIAGWVAQHKRPALVPDVSEDERWVSLPNGEASRRRSGAMLAVPLIAHSQVMGVITLSHPAPGFFNDDHLRLLAACGGEIATGIHNANLYKDIVGEMERRADLVHQLERNAGLNAAILQSLSDGVLVCDADGHMLTVNTAAESIMQRSLEELLLADMHDLLGQLAAKRASELPLDDLLAQPVNEQREPRMFQSTFQIGTRTVSVTLGPVLTERQEMVGAFGLLRDITREVEADRLKTEFIGTMSHELRTPMTSIKGFTQLLAMGGLGPVNETQRESLGTIYTNAERMISIINDVLDITKIETGAIDLELRPLHLAESIGSAVSDMQSLIHSREHRVNITIRPGLPLVMADARRLHQVLVNLISNAVKYTPRSGEVQVEAREVAHEALPPRVGERLSSRRRYVQVDVRDTGVGIAPEEHDLIFERFYRTENPMKIEAGGTGLGLSLVRPLIALLSGHVWVTSAVDEGSTFSIVLPVA